MGITSELLVRSRCRVALVAYHQDLCHRLEISVIPGISPDIFDSETRVVPVSHAPGFRVAPPSPHQILVNPQLGAVDFPQLLSVGSNLRIEGGE